MKNYPNMSYCAFENTALALQQLMEIINDELEEGRNYEEFLESRSSLEERSAVKRVRKNCEALLDLFEAID
jgi:hypothetical protein